MSAVYVIGLAGGIGAGKSSVANQFALNNVEIVDTDEISHRLTEPNGQAMTAIHAAFGNAVVSEDGSLDRMVMRDLVFATLNAKAQLEAILHPMIRRAAMESLTVAQKKSAPYAMLVVPLLFEQMGFRGTCNRTLVVDCPEPLQVARVQGRSNLTPEVIRRIMATQISRAIRLQLADDVISNAFAPESIPAQVATLHARYVARAGGHG